MASTRTQIRSLWTAGALGGLSQSLAGVAGGLLAREAGQTGTVAGLPQAMLVIGAAASALGISELTRRHGRRVALGTGALTAAVGCGVVVAGGLWSALAWILVGSLLLGAGQTAVMLGRYAAADLGVEADRAGAMASVLVATTVGAVLGPNLLSPAGAIAADVGLPVLVGPYVLAGTGLLLAAAALVGGLQDDGARESRRRDNPSVRLGRDGLAGLVVLGVANLVMVAVMTMAPVHLHHAGTGLGAIGLVVSAHIAGMFAPSPLSAWLTRRFGAHLIANLAGATLAAACLMAAVAASTTGMLASALVLLGVGWNLALVSGSVLLTTDVPSHARPRREGWGEVGMGFAAALGGAASGVVATTGGYPLLAATTATVAVALVPFLTLLGRPPRPDVEHVARRMVECNVGDYAEAETDGIPSRSFL